MIQPGVRKSLLVMATLLGALSRPARVEAQEARSNTRGLLLGLGATGMSMEIEDGDPQAGGGGYLSIGYAPSRLVTIFLRADGTTVDIDVTDITGSYTMAFVDLGLRFSFGGPQSAFIPWVTGAFTAQAAGATIPITPLLESDVTISGTGFTLGGGFDVFLTQTLALDVGLLLTSGRFSEVSLGSLSTQIDELESRAARVTIGLAWYPIKPRS